MYKINLKKLTKKNATDEYLKWLNDPDVNKYLESRHQMHTLESISKYIVNVNDSLNEMLFGIFCIKTEKHIGNIKIGPIDLINKRAEIGLLVGDKNYWGKGIATEAIELICNYAKSELGLHKIEAGCYTSNIGSLKAFEKAGFSIEGILKDHAKSNEAWVDCYRLGRVININKVKGQ